MNFLLSSTTRRKPVGQQGDPDPTGASSSALFWLHQGCQVPFRTSRRNLGLLLRCCSGQGPHLALTGDPRVFPRVAAGFFRETRKGHFSQYSSAFPPPSTASRLRNGTKRPLQSFLRQQRATRYTTPTGAAPRDHQEVGGCTDAGRKQAFRGR